MNADDAATRLRLPPARDRWSEPWRQFILEYLAFLCEIADYEQAYFGHDEARIALETLRADIDDLLALLDHGRKRA